MKSLLTPMRLAGLAALLLIAAPVTAQNIYKCTTAGQVAYTDHPCPDGTGQLLHKADDAEVIDQYLRLGQDKLARQYAESRHLDELYQQRLKAYQQTQDKEAQRQAAEAMAEQKREKQQALADAAARRAQLRDENDALRQENQDYRNQLEQPVYNAPPAYWGRTPSYGYGRQDGYRGYRDHRDRDRDRNHYDPHEPHRPQPQQQPVFHPCTQLAGGRVKC